MRGARGRVVMRCTVRTPHGAPLSPRSSLDQDGRHGDPAGPDRPMRQRDPSPKIKLRSRRIKPRSGSTSPRLDLIRSRHPEHMSDSRLLAAEIALRLASARDHALDTVVTEALATLAALAEVDRAYVTLLDADGTFENSHEWTMPHIVPHQPAIQRLRADRFPYSVGLAHDDQIFDAPDVDDLPAAARAERDSFASFGVRSVLQVPIRVDGRAIGLVGYNRVNPITAWSPELIETTRRVGQAIGIALVRKRAAVEIREAWKEADRANRAKDALFADVSHELRTPLHALLGYAELLELDDRPEREQRALHEIRSNGRRLLTLVEDLIHMADLRGGETGSEATPIGPIVRETIDALAPAGALRNITFATEEGVDSGRLVVDPGRLRQVVHCVLSGGLHTLVRGGTISVGLDAGSARTGNALLVVTLTSERSFRATSAVTPLARALMDGFGTIELRSVPPGVDGGHTARVEIDFVCDQVARP